MTAMPGPSTNAIHKARNSSAHQNERQHQREWIRLIDAWQTVSVSPTSFGTGSRDELVEEISHHAQILCRSMKDRSWLLDAFQMAIEAVVFSNTDGTTSEDSAELARVEQLGQQLLQLAIHSVAGPYLNTLKSQGADSARIQSVVDLMKSLEQLSRRLSMYERQRGLAQGLSFPTLPFSLVLEEPSSTILLCLASLPEGAKLIAPLLQSFPWLVAESASSRLSILTQLLTTGAVSKEEYASLAASGLVIGWKDGHESGAWETAHGAPQLSLNELVAYYSTLIEEVTQIRSVAHADALNNVLANEMQGLEAQQALSQLRSTAATSSTDTGGSQQRGSNTAKSAAARRFDLASVHGIASKVSRADPTHGAREQLAKELLLAGDVASVAVRIAQLVDTNDSVSTRSLGLTVVSQAASTKSSASEELGHLTVAIMYARPAIGQFRLDLDTPQSLLEEAETALGQLQHGHQHNTNSKSSKLGSSLRSALSLDRQSVVPACQLLVLLSSGSQEGREGLLNEMRLHLGWLKSIAALIEGQSAKPSNLDLCWLAAYGGVHQSESSTKAKEEAERQQKVAFDSLLASFDAATPPPTSLGGRPDRPGVTDPALVRFRAAWDAFYHQVLRLTGSVSPSAPFALVSETNAQQRLLSQILRTGDVDLFRSLSTSSGTPLSPAQLEDLIIEVSTQLFDKTDVATTRSKDIRLSLDVLSALPSSSPLAKSQRDFIEAACRLSSFKVKSILQPGSLMGPKEIRETPDRMELVARLLATQGDAHRSPELVLDVANRLCGLSPSTADKTLVEARTLAMLADAATAAEDFEEASAFCQRLVDKVTTVRARSSSSPTAAAIVEIGWKTCFQLSKHPLWEDTPARITMLAHAMTICPPGQLSGMLRQWTLLDEQLAREVGEGKEFASTRKETEVGGWLGKTGELGSVGAMVGNAANLLPLSFSPLSYFGNSATSGNVAQRGGGLSEKQGGVDERTARLFDFDGVSGSNSAGGGGYVDPTERAVRAARAARDFLGWKSDQHGSEQQQQQQGGGRGAIGGFSFSRGVGWLIGDAEKR